MGVESNGGTKINRRSEAAKKRAADLLARDPEHFAKIARRVKRRGSEAAAPTGFAGDSDAASRAGRKGAIIRKENRLAASDSDRV